MISVVSHMIKEQLSRINKMPSSPGMLFRGVPLEEMSKDQLIIVITYSVKHIQSLSEEHKREMYSFIGF